MYVLTALVVFFSGITLLNLVLTVGLVRRMRQADSHGHDSAGEQQGGLKPGEAAPSLDLADARAERRTLLGFFSTDCPACPGHLPGFREAADHFDGSAAAVLSGRSEKYELLESGLGGAVQPLYERGDAHMGAGPIIEGFKVDSWPSFFLLDPDGKVEAVGLDALARAAMAKVLV